MSWSYLRASSQGVVRLGRKQGGPAAELPLSGADDAAQTCSRKRGGFSRATARRRAPWVRGLRLRLSPICHDGPVAAGSSAPGRERRALGAEPSPRPWGVERLCATLPAANQQPQRVLMPALNLLAECDLLVARWQWKPSVHAMASRSEAELAMSAQLAMTWAAAIGGHTLLPHMRLCADSVRRTGWPSGPTP